MRCVIVTLAISLALASLLCGGCGEKNEAEPSKVVNGSSTTLPADSKTPAVTSPSESSSEDNILTGTTSQETRRFELAGGATTFSFVVVGTKPGFEAILVEKSTGREINVIKDRPEPSFTVDETVSAPEGTYVFRVLAYGPWTITIGE